MRVIANGDEIQPALLANSCDWTGRIPNPQVRNQGAFQACVSCAIAGMIEARYWLSYEQQIRVVPGYIHNCLFDIHDHSTSVDPGDALDRIQQNGIARGNDDRIPVPDDVCASTELLRIDDCGWVVGRNAILNDLFEKGPLLATMTVEENSFRSLGNEIYQKPGDGGRTYDHSVLLVGYDLDEGWVRFVNSFGTAWGVGGAARARFESGGLLRDFSAAAALFG